MSANQVVSSEAALHKEAKEEDSLVAVGLLEQLELQEVDCLVSHRSQIQRT
jgi:hypothetical protein